jgi:hypothetical protein
MNAFASRSDCVVVGWNPPGGGSISGLPVIHARFLDMNGLLRRIHGPADRKRTPSEGIQL